MNQGMDQRRDNKTLDLNHPRQGNAAMAISITARAAVKSPARGFALFEYGLRPFFLLVGLHGALVIPVWVAVVLGWLRLPVEMEVSWHAHQMVYGFAAAGFAGFLLTAVPNWTGAPARRGMPVIALAALWVIGRVATTLSTVFSPPLAALLDLAFVPALASLVVRPLLAAGKPRNLALLVPLTLFWVGDWLMHAEFIGISEDTAATGARLGIDVMLLMITIIGGRMCRPLRGMRCEARARHSSRGNSRGSTAGPSHPWRCCWSAKPSRV